MNIQYIAGFFDGEGSIVISKNRIRISLPQTNKEILEEIKKYFGVGNLTVLKKRKEHWKDAWSYYVSGSKACFKVLNELEPYLILKKDKAKKGLSFIQEIKDKEQNKIERNKLAISYVNKGMSYRQVEKLTGICRQTLCNEIKKVRGSA